MHSGDARLCRAHTLLWMAVPVGCVTVASFMGEAVSMESDSPVPWTAASSAPAWYYHTAVSGADEHFSGFF